MNRVPGSNTFESPEAGARMVVESTTSQGVTRTRGGCREVRTETSSIVTGAVNGSSGVPGPLSERNDVMVVDVDRCPVGSTMW